jgi:hypothetical protein
MASPTSYHPVEEGLQDSLPKRRIRLHHNPHLSVRPDRFHGLLQGPRAQPQGAFAILGSRGGGEIVQILQPGHPPSELCSSQLCPESSAINDQDVRQAMLYL